MPWIASQTCQLLAQRGHAWLLHGPSGLGQYSLALNLVRAWLCDRPTADGACENCASCHALEVRAHADLCVLMPETVMLELGWPLTEKAQQEIDEKKRKPSKEIRIEAMRDAVEFAQRTSARGMGKAVLVYPAERMNHITANALLKTLEEPAGDLRFALAADAAHQLLATIRSRCQSHTLAWPQPDEALAWLVGVGLEPANALGLLRAAGGRPEDALQLAQSGADAKQWELLPKALAKGDGTVLAGWSPAHAVDVLQKLCHDLLASAAGAQPRFFRHESLPTGPSLLELSDWSRALTRAARTVEHPFNAGLMLESLVSQASSTLNSKV